VSYILQHRPLCLASSSPRRKELLKKFNLEFDCYTPNIDEKPDKSEHAESFVKRMAIEKGRKIHRTCLNLAQDVIILAADTIVFFNGQILGKPKTIRHAKSMLSQLNDNLHTPLGIKPIENIYLQGLTFYIGLSESYSIVFKGEEINTIINPPDETGKKSITIPWKKLDYPNIDII